MSNLGQASINLGGTAYSANVHTAGTVAFFRVPSDDFSSSITIVEAQVAARAGGTATVRLVDMGSAGTSVAGTIVSLALAATSNAPLGSVLATPYALDPGDYLGYEITAGTTTIPAYLNVSFLRGK